MAAVLTVVDNAAVPSGVVATIAGSGGASTNAMFYMRVDAGQTFTTWQTAGTRTGDGTVAITLNTGIYWFRCDNTSGGSTVTMNFVLLGVTDGLKAVHERIIAGIVAGLPTLIAAGKIPGIGSAQRIVDMTELDFTKMDFPALAVCTQLSASAPAEQQLGGSNLRDDIGFATYVVFLDNPGGKYVEARPSFLLARQNIFRWFRQQHLAGVADVYNCKPEPGPVLEIKRDSLAWVGTTLLLRHLVRDIRG